MAHRRKKATTLSQADLDRFVAAAIQLHHACCTPLLAVSSEHYRALRDLNQAIVRALEIVTGEQNPPWVSWRTSPSERGPDC
jgi:hypothetical protein